MSAGYRTTEVPVRGGLLRTAIWGTDDAPAVLAVHGVTANHLSWSLLAEALPDVRLIAPDLRGRGRSSELPGPWGMGTHAEDLAAVIETLVGRPLLVVGHSMGAFAAVALALRRPELVDEVLLVDGGLPFMTRVELGPALQRLSMTFDSAQAYRDFWRDHPALRDDWSSAVVDYVDYDLVGSAPNLHSGVSPDAVQADSAELFGGGGGLDRRLSLITAPRGLLDDSPGLYSDEVAQAWQARLPQLEVTRAPGVNHYTVVMSTRGAALVATKIHELLSGRHPQSPSRGPQR